MKIISQTPSMELVYSQQTGYQSHVKEFPDNRAAIALELLKQLVVGAGGLVSAEEGRGLVDVAFEMADRYWAMAKANNMLMTAPPIVTTIEDFNNHVMMRNFNGSPQ